MTSVDHERRIVRIISARRQELGISYQAMAEQMREHGSQITGPALYKTEKGNPHRKLTISDLMAAVKTLELGIGDVLPETHSVPVRTIKLLACNAVSEDANYREQSRRSESATLSAVEALESYLESDQEVTYANFQMLSDTLSILDTLDHYALDGRVGMVCAKLRELLKETP